MSVNAGLAKGVDKLRMLSSLTLHLHAGQFGLRFRPEAEIYHFFSVMVGGENCSNEVVEEICFSQIFLDQT